MENPAKYADSVRDAYQSYLQGRGGTATRSVAARLQPDSAGESSLAGMRGPYLQALPIANWSDTGWRSFAASQSLHPNIKRAFHEEGFRRLYDFQERSVDAILDGDDTVITAATGRGKTEAWLIPILDQIVKAKSSTAGDGRTSTKALLLYPTKALAQDQFKRLVQLLYRINRNLRRKEWVTVGIYDGDTPRNIYESKAQGYLNSTFRHVACPGANDDLEKCRNCSQGVFVERSTDDYRLRPDKPECEDDEAHPVPLDFVRLTKNSILENGADIILTNPDTLNYRLLNVNAHTERAAFAYDPSFIVFDEVHTYDGLLGSYTATLIKRLRRLREDRDCDPLQVIGSSATVENDAELFRQISGASDITQVSERPRELPDNPPAEIPQALREEAVDPEEVLEAGSQGRTPPQVGAVELAAPDGGSLDNDRVTEIVSDKLYQQYTDPDADDRVARTIQALHTELLDDPRPPEAVVADCADRFDLSVEEAQTLVDNFQQLGEVAGLLESRHHLFSWPLDGFYACAGCDAVYRSPQDRCSVCDAEFVTRATYCRECDEEHLIANACSRCDQLTPYVHTNEGLLGDDDPEACPHCESTAGSSVPMHRVTFRPWHECTDCWHRSRRAVTADCPICGATGVPADDRGEYTCRNPDCGHTWQETWQCTVCGGSERTLAKTEDSARCTDCGTAHAGATLPTTCDCGERVTSTRLIPWVCDDETCTSTHFDRRPPDSCSCGATTFAKGALYDVAAVFDCGNCGETILPGGDCGCATPSHSSDTDPYRKYRTFDPDRGVVSPLDHRRALPCHHSLYSTVVDQVFDELLRSPTNVAVTTSQYLLRDLTDAGGFEAAKLLAFSDSHRDMKELDRAFTDPEIDTLLDQLVLAAIDLEAAGVRPEALDKKTLHRLRYDDGVLGGVDVGPKDRDWVSLADVAETGYELLLRLEDELAGDDPRDAQTVDLAAVVLGSEYVRDKERAIRDRLRRQAVRHVGETRGRDRPSLEHDGLLDVRLSAAVQEAADDTETAILDAVATAGNNAKFDDVVDDTRESNAAANRLLQQGVLERRGADDERIAFIPGVLEVVHAGHGDIEYDPFEDIYYATVRPGDHDEAVPCADTIAERTNPDRPRFSERAFTTTRSRVAMLSSRLYYGSTPKMQRRQIEHRFRDGPEPNFLSSGPTMELGVDIGSLDALLMYGTPPNMNAYLQRVGRAGRASGSALVHSVSQRNPIDYYYYDEPTELITAEEQPVPLNEHNDRVIEISLAWAVLDYVAANFVIPWEVSRNTVSGGSEFQRLEDAPEHRREEASKFTHLLGRSVSQLELDEESSKLRPLRVIIEDNATEIQEYLESLLAYAYCPDCHRHYYRSRTGDPCGTADCAGTLVDAQADHREAIDDAIGVVQDVFIDGYQRQVNRTRERIAGIDARRTELEAEVAAADKPSPRLQRAIEQADSRIDVLEEYLSELATEDYGDLLTEVYAEYAFNLRSVSDSVDVSVVDESGEPTRIGDDRGGRSSRLALGELHPGAAYLHNRRPYVVSQVFTDEKTTTDIRETVDASSGEEAASGLAADYVCRTCGTATPQPEADGCDCGEQDWQERQLFAMESVEATLDTVILPNDHSPAGEVYVNANDRVQNTFSRRQTAILEFDTQTEFELVTGDGVVGHMALGDYEVLEYTQQFQAKYQGGGQDSEPTLFELCAEPDCPGIVYEDEADTRRCSVSPDHAPDDGDEAVYARFGYQYSTTGLRVRLSEAGTEATHALAHGFRLALQKLSGVPIRDVSEHVSGDHVDVFDTQEGGAAVARQLVQERADVFRNFRVAVEMLGTQFDCDCSDGCPRCVYQYGCAEWNSPHTLAVDPVQELVKDGLELTRLE